MLDNGKDTRESDEEEIDVEDQSDEVCIHYKYVCKHCDYESWDPHDVDCDRCGSTFCMLARETLAPCAGEGCPDAGPYARGCAARTPGRAVGRAP